MLICKDQIFVVHDCGWMGLYCCGKKTSANGRLNLAKKPLSTSLITMLSTSKNVLFPGHNHLLTSGADDPTLWLSSECQLVVSWWIFTFLHCAQKRETAALKNEILTSKTKQSTVVPYSHNQTFSVPYSIIMYSIQEQNITSLQYTFPTG